MMMKHSLFINFIVVTLLATLLAVECGRVSPVYGLADPQPEVWLTPVYDTTIYQFSDYVDTLTAPQYEIFKIALGVYIAAQGGANQYDLVDPFTTRDGVIGWFKSLGLTAYNSLIDLVPDTYVDPVTGSVNSTAQSKELVKYAVAYAMGAAVLAANYNTEQDFIDDINDSDNMFFHFGPVAQAGINGLVALNGGFYNWQFQPMDWDDGSFSWNQANLSGTQLIEYNAAVAALPMPRTFANSYDTGYKGIVVGSTDFFPTFDLFINTTDHSVSFHNTSGFSIPCTVAFYGQPVGGVYTLNGYVTFKSLTYDPSDFQSYQQIALFYLNNHAPATTFSTNNLVRITNLNGWFVPYLKPTLFLDRVMVGATWETAVPVESLTDLDFQLNNIQYYEQVQNDYLFDIRQFILDLIDNTDLYTPWINNIYDLDGVIVHDPDLIRVTTDIYDLINTQNPVLPVNLNDLDEVTTNNYVDEVKRASEGVASAIGEYVAFWHNADYVTVYVLLGCSLLVLVAALVGKMGK